MNQDEPRPILLDEFRHRRRPRPTIPPPAPPPFRPSAMLRQFIREVVFDAITDHELRLHGRAG